MIAPPEGWVRADTEQGWIWAPEADLDDLRVSGLERPWAAVAGGPSGPGTGRGATGRVTSAGGRPLFVKHYCRGGLLAAINPDRYFALGRFRRELEVGRRARAAGLPLGEVFAQVFRPAAPGWRVWGIAHDLVEGVDLARRLASATPPEAAQLWRAALATLRQMGDVGLDHPDLNLGNLVGVPSDEGPLVFHVVDLDRASFSGRSLPVGARHAMLARLDRSWRKIFGDEGRLSASDRAAIAQEIDAP